MIVYSRVCSRVWSRVSLIVCSRVFWLHGHLPSQISMHKFVLVRVKRLPFIQKAPSCLRCVARLFFPVHFIIMLWTLKHFSPMHILEMSNKSLFTSCFTFILWTPKLLSPVHSLQMGSKITSVCGFIITFWTLKLFSPVHRIEMCRKRLHEHFSIWLNNHTP